jgi:hypothetical protein
MTGDERQYLADEYTVSEIPTIPAGTYDATLEGVTSEDHELYGHRWVWHMLVPEMHPDGGDFELQVWTPPRISSTGMARDMAGALGADVTKGAKGDLGSVRGRRVRLVVTLDEEKGRNRVKGVMPATAPAPPSDGVDPEYEAFLAQKAAKEAGDEGPPQEEAA